MFAFRSISAIWLFVLLLSSYETTALAVNAVINTEFIVNAHPVYRLVKALMLTVAPTHNLMLNSKFGCI